MPGSITRGRRPTAQGGLAKTIRPSARGAVARPRLFRRLDRRRNAPLLWIAGSPGAGKTTLVSSYVEARRLTALWYQLDEGDADVGTFFFHLGRAASRGRARSRPLPVLRPEHWLVLPAFTRRFFEDLYGRLRRPLLLVLDNYQEVPAHSRLHGALVEGLAALPAGSRAIIVSRHDPPEEFARLRANGSLQVLGPDALRLTPAEALDIVSRRGRRLPAPLVRRLHERTDGWLAGLVLLLEELPLAGDGPALAGGGAPQVVFDYFAAETFRTLDAGSQDFLLRTAFLPRMTAALAAELSGLPAASRVLARLHASNYFTERRAGDEVVYQYHPLFREFLQARARATLTLDRLVDVQRKAAQLLAHAGQAEDAVGLLRETGDGAGLAALVVAHAHDLVAHGRHQTLEEWASHVPAPVADDTAWLQYWLGISRTPFAPVMARRNLERAWELFRVTGDVTGTFSAWAGVVGTILYEWSDFTQLDRWIDDLEALLRQQPEFPSRETETRVSATMFYALMFRRPQHSDIEVWAERARTLSRTADATRRMLTGFMLATYDLWMGRHAGAAASLEQLKALAAEPGAPALVTLCWRVVEAHYHWHMAEPDRCLQAMTSGLDLARRSGVRLMDANLLAQGVYGALIGGDSARARALLAELTGVVQEAGDVNESQYHFLMGWEALLARDLPRALEHARRGLGLVSGAPVPQAWNEIAVAIVLHEVGETVAARGHLANGRATGRALRSRMIEFMALLAEAHFALAEGRSEEATAALTDALALGRANGYRATAWWRPDVMARLCARALETGIEVSYVRDLIRAHRLSPESPATAPGAWPWPLTIRALGAFTVTRDGAVVTFTGKIPQRPLALLKALVALGGRDVPEEQLTDFLWPNAEGDAAHQVFATTLHRLRDLLGLEGALHLQEGRLTLDARHVWLDVWSFERLLLAAEQAERRGDRRASLTLLERALGLYRGPLLAGEPRADWAISARERLRDKFCRATSRLCRCWTEAGEWERAAEGYARGLDVDDLAEEFYQGLMQCYEGLGRRGEAMRVAERCRHALATVLGVEPSPATQAIARRLGTNQRHPARPQAAQTSDAASATP
jgi:LuxR family transcriptional regulator, maltose regulon positive regulatory protein